MKKNLNDQRNQLKVLLILNDFYQILYYLRLPFFEFGNKAAQQITNLPIFFSFFIMFLGIFQISFDTRNSSILKNYPLLVDLADNKIPQKFETLYLQFLDNKEIQKIQLQERRKKAETQLYQQLDEKEILFMDFYKYLKTTPSGIDVPTIFHQIQNKKQKQDTINLYKTFEQIGPILLSELRKEERKAKTSRQKEETLIHLGIDIPYQNWSSTTKNFNILEDKNLTNWQFKDSNLIIKDLKKKNHLNKAYNIVQQFLVQYNNYVNENKKYIYLKDKIFPFQKIQIIQNVEKIDLKMPTPSRKPMVFWPTRFPRNLVGMMGKRLETIAHGTNWGLYPPRPELADQFPLESQGHSFRDDAIPQQEEDMSIYDKPPFEWKTVEQMKTIQKFKTSDPKNTNRLSLQSYEKRLKKKLAQFQKKLLSGKELELARRQGNTKQSQKSFFKQKNIKGTKNSRTIPIGTKKWLNTHRILRFLSEARLIRGDLSQTPLRSQRKQHETHIALLQSELPSMKQSALFDFNSMNILNQIQKIEDQIPTKLQGSQEFRPTFTQPTDYQYVNSTAENSPAEKWSLFGDTQYQAREYELITYDKKVWTQLHEQLSKLQVKTPNLMVLYDQSKQETKKRSLLNIQIILQKREPLTNFIQFLEFTQKKIPIFQKFLRKFEKFQLKELKHIGQLDIEIQEWVNENSVNPKVDYRFQLDRRSIQSKPKVEMLPKPVRRRFFLEKIWSIPKPEFLYLNNFEIFFKGVDDEYYYPGNLKTHFNYMNWRQNQIQKTFDNYRKTISYLLQLQEKNPYFYLDEIILPEDYLLETLFFFIKQNLTTLEKKMQNFESKNSMHQNSMHQMFNPKNKTPFPPSIAISKIFDYLNNRKKQRNLFLKNSGKILQIKNLLEKKRKIQTAFLYDSILNNYFCDSQILKKILKSFEFSLQDRKSPGKKIQSGFLNPTGSKIQKIQFQLKKLKLNKIFKSNWLEVFYRPLENHFLKQEYRNYSSAFNQFGLTPMNLASHKRFAMQFIWFTMFKRTEFLTKSNIALLPSYSLREKQPPTENPVWVNWIKLHTQNQRTPYECMDKYYFLRKLPKIPKNIDHPAIVIKKTNTIHKKSYPYRIINLPIITPFKQKKINYAKAIINKLNFAGGNDGIQFNFYNQFDSIANEDLAPQITGIKHPNKGARASGQQAAQRPLIKGQRKHGRSWHDVFQKIHFTKTIDEVLDDLNHYPKDKSSEIHRIQKCLSQKQPIYQNVLSRQMSGYLFPDLERKQLSNLVLKPFKRLEKNQIIEIPITNKNIDIDDFIQQLPDLSISRSKYSIRTPFRIFKHQQKIYQKGFLESQFFEFRENFNDYSWSIFFFLSSGWVFMNIFQNLYKKYAKEFVESGIDFLKRAGILDDVQWIKEELGMTPIDKGYRGIRHQGKKFRNIIGLDRKYIISQVSEMVWFLKTKKWLQSTDPFVQIILLFSDYFAKTRLLEIQRANSSILPVSLPIEQEHEPIQIKMRTLITKKDLPNIDVVCQTLDDIIFLNSEQNRMTSSPTLRPFRFHLRASSLLVDQKIKKSEPLSVTDTEIRGLDKSVPISLMAKQHYLKPKGFLFTGPPGTGKTLLVQAIAGETGVPVVTQSGGLLQSPRLRGRGAKTLHKLFLRAREISPCMIFIDEIDGIGTRRQFLPLYIDIYGRYDPIEVLYRLESQEGPTPPKTFQPKLQRREEFLDDHDPYWKEPEFTQIPQSTRIPIDVLQDIQSSRGARSEQLSILTQLLIELDGLHVLENILVIGATNRLEILDPALMRPGRFQRILKFNLPDYAARIHLFKLYTQASKIGIENISWDYFSKRTHGLSSADIASIVFASELTAIEKSQKHSFESLERGIDLITSFPSDPVMFRLKNVFIFLENKIQNFLKKNSFYYLSKLDFQTPLSDEDLVSVPLGETSNIYRNCYYNIGKIVLLSCLQIFSSSSAYISLWIRPKNFRFFFFTKNFNEFDEFEEKMFSRKDIEKRLLAFFGGKAGESLFIFLPLNQFCPEIYFQFDPTFISLNHSLQQSNFGIEDEIQTAQILLKLMIEKWYFYLERIATENFHPILENANLWEYSESEKELFLGQALVDEMIIDLDMRNRLSKNEQKYSYLTWWMKKVATRLNFRENLVLQWSRIYLSDPENSAQNIEWSAPDEYFHTLLRTPPNCMAWTHFLENGRFAVSNLLLLQSFNTAFRTLRQFSELMDFLSDYFLRYECLRENEFKRKISQFFYYYLLQNNKIQ